MGVKTKILEVNELSQAAELLARGQVVAFPTETVYGLGANALNVAAVAKIFAAKGRPQDNPLIVHCGDQNQVRQYVQAIPKDAQRLMDRFWPGPLTLVLRKTNLIPPEVTGELDTVGVRIPDHPLALELLNSIDFPLAAPSANLSGRPSPTRAEHVLIDLEGKIPAILDGGETGWGLESTVLDCTVQPFRLLRPGGVTLEQLQTITPIELDEGLDAENFESPRSPGMKYQHYAPDAQVYLVLGEGTLEKIHELSEDYLENQAKVGVMTWQERAKLYPDFTVLSMGSEGDLASLAKRLYHLLREADRLGLDVLFIEGVDDQHLGLAIMNRLRRAASNREIWT